MKIRMTSRCENEATIEFEGDIEEFFKVNGGDDEELLKANLGGYDRKGFLAELTHGMGKVDIPGCVGLVYTVEPIG